MLHIGVTGGIAAGKSTITAALTELGAHRIDADLLAREVVAPGTPGLQDVIETFGPGIVTAEGELDRPALGRLVFEDPDQLARLNAIVHPLVARRTAELIASLPPAGIVVHDVPLIVESDLSANYHLVLVAGAGERERLRRLTQGRGMTEEQARARIRAQADDDARRAVADVWLDTAAPREEIRKEIEGLWRDRLAPYAQNIAQGRAAARIGPAVLAEPPPPPRSWAVQAEQILARLRRVGADRIRTADHIGSTSVPGLVAKDVLDLQLGVASIEDAAAVCADLCDAGFPVRTDITADSPKPHEPDPAQWVKRFHVSADPGRPVNLHIRVIGGPGWTFALGFRDWLRAEEAVRDEYAAVKQGIAAATSDTEQYAVTKEPWFTKVWPRLQAWIEHSRWQPPPA